MNSMNPTDGIRSLIDVANHELSSMPRQNVRRRRIVRACDRCHRHASRCEPGPEGSPCSRCKEHGSECTYDRPVKRRGPPPSRRAPRNTDRPSDAAQDNVPDDPSPISQSMEDPCGSSATRMSPTLNDGANLNSPVYSAASTLYAQYEDVISPDTIESLIDHFYHCLYPLWPYFHWPTFRTQIKEQQYRNDWGIFLVTMAVCALTAARLCDGASASDQQMVSQAATLAKTCYSATVKTLPSDISSVVDTFPLMKANALLTSACLQSKDFRRAIVHMGDYISLSISTGFHLEANWPKDLNEIQKQERRRLFWGAYQQDQYIANNLGYLSRQRESKATVLYPAEVFDDQDISETKIHLQSERVSFLRGWNFCTDLYRLLEHVDNTVRAKRDSPVDQPGELVTAFLSRPSRHFGPDCLRLVSTLHENLPPELKSVKQMTGDPLTDRYGFIASNILITTQTLKMLLVGAEKSSVHMRCAIASELLDELSVIPIGYFHGSSSLQHLAHVGYLLGTVIQGPLSAWTYLQVRNILLVLAQFLERIEAYTSSSPGLAAKLRLQISRIDEYMQHKPQSEEESTSLSMDQSFLSELSNTRSKSYSSSNNANSGGGNNNMNNNAGQPRSSQFPLNNIEPFTNQTTSWIRDLHSNNIAPTHSLTPSNPTQQQHQQEQSYLHHIISSEAQNNSLLPVHDTPYLGTNVDFFNKSAGPYHNLGTTDLLFPQRRQASLPPDLVTGWPFLFEQQGNINIFDGIIPDANEVGMSTPTTQRLQ